MTSKNAASDIRPHGTENPSETGEEMSNAEKVERELEAARLEYNRLYPDCRQIRHVGDTADRCFFLHGPQQWRFRNEPLSDADIEAIERRVEDFEGFA